jgi:hypothetical protein
MPSSDNLNGRLLFYGYLVRHTVISLCLYLSLEKPYAGIVWFGCLFVHKGFYRSGVFKFRINIPESYPNAPPTVTFLTDMFHPLVDTQGRLSIAQQFPVWRPHQDYIFHILHYIKNAYKRVVLDGLVEKYCPNKEAYRLYVFIPSLCSHTLFFLSPVTYFLTISPYSYRNDPQIFSKLAQQCAQLSITESYLFDHFPDNNMIKFSPLSESKFGKLAYALLRHNPSYQ